MPPVNVAMLFFYDSAEYSKPRLVFHRPMKAEIGMFVKPLTEETRFTCHKESFGNSLRRTYISFAQYPHIIRNLEIRYLRFVLFCSLFRSPFRSLFCSVFCSIFHSFFCSLFCSLFLLGSLFHCFFVLSSLSHLPLFLPLFLLLFLLFSSLLTSLFFSFSLLLSSFLSLYSCG